VLVVAATLLSIAATGADAERPGLPKSKAAEIDRIVENALAAGGTPGASIAIERHGRVIYQKGFGYADVENEVKVTPETVFPIGSITKTMTGLAINQLIAAGKVELDAPVGHYLPDLTAPDRGVPIRYLLDHLSGIIGYTEIPGFPGDAQQSMTRQEVVGWFAARSLLYPPGTRWNYTNSGFYLLGLVIEAVSGGSYADYLQAHEFGPFGMTHTSLASWQTVLAHRAHGYRRGPHGLENAPRYDPLFPFAAGAVMSTSGDLLKYRRGVFGDGPTPAKLREALVVRDVLPDGFVLPYSLGSLVCTDFEGHRRIGHPGDIHGFEAQYSFYPDDDLTIVILTNNQNAPFPPISIEQKIVRVVLGIPAPARRDAALPASTAERLAGEYEVGDLRFGFDRIAFSVTDGVLQMAVGGTGAPSLPLRYQGGTRFVSSLDDEQWIEFTAGTDPVRVKVAFYGSPLELHRIATAAQ
jgi:CubicO group peptidase (beta-lactamase class C family)